MPVQLPLPFDFHTNQSFTSYHTGPNTETVLSLKSSALGLGSELIFVWGDSGVGKSHLLQSCCQIATRNRLRPAYLPLKAISKYGPVILDGLENLNLICVDDIHTLCGEKEWEAGFFNFFNRIREAGNHLIISGLKPASRMNIDLDDLKSRLAWGLTLKLEMPGDEDKLAALTLRAESLGFSMPARVGNYLLRHYPRDLPSLWNFLDTLDKATLSAKRKLTIPFVKKYLDCTNPNRSNFANDF